MKATFSALIWATHFFMIGASLVVAQEPLTFKGLLSGAGKPVEINADQLLVSDKDGQAIFSGNVKVVQGELHLSSDELIVEYVKGDKTKIDSLHASGHVLMATSTEAAESQTATYSLANGQLEMAGNVLLTQAEGAISGEKMTIDLNTGIGQMGGRVKTVLQPGGN